MFILDSSFRYDAGLIVLHDDSQHSPRQVCMAHPRPYPQNLNERSARTAEPPNGAGADRTEISSETIAGSAVAVAEYENTMSADRLIDRLKAQEQLAAALN